MIKKEYLKSQHFIITNKKKWLYYDGYDFNFLNFSTPGGVSPPLIVQQIRDLLMFVNLGYK